MYIINFFYTWLNIIVKKIEFKNLKKIKKNRIFLEKMYKNYCMRNKYKFN